MTTKSRRAPTGFLPEQQLYQPLSVEEDRSRTNSHYEQPVEFFETVTGGEWNVYSCNLWHPGQTVTGSQEAKLDLLAELMGLRPGQRILDVGCGWGGPLVYLSKKYGVRGVGLTLSAVQKQAAEARIARYGVDVQIVESHWSDFQDDEGFDAIYTDEVIVHFFHLGDYFEKVHALLKPGGCMLNKELHMTHPKYAEMSRAMSFINEIFGTTGNYRTLADELALVNHAGFEMRTIHQLPTWHYQQTVDQWEANLLANRATLEPLVGRPYFQRFRTYLKLCYFIHGTTRMTLDIVVSHKVDGLKD